MANIRDTMSFTNRPDVAEEKGYQYIPENYAGGEAVSGGTGLVAGTDADYTPIKSPSELALESVAKRKSFEQTVFKQIGGDPRTMTADKAIKEYEQANRGYYSLFNRAFEGVLHYSDRGRMTPEQKNYWNQVVAGRRADIAKMNDDTRAGLESQHKELMDEYDRYSAVAEKDERAKHKANAKAQQDKVKAEQKSRLKKKVAKKQITQTTLDDYTKRTEGWDGEYFVREVPERQTMKEDGKRTWDEAYTEIAHPTPQELQAINIAARNVGEPEFYAIEREQYDEEGNVLEANIEYTRREMPSFSDDNLQEIIKEGRDILDISGFDPLLGEQLQNSFNQQVQTKLSPESITELSSQLQTTRQPAQTENLADLMAEFRSLQQSGDEQGMITFDERVERLPQETRTEFMEGLSKRPSGTITSATNKVQVKAEGTVEENRRKGYDQRKKARAGRRERTAQIAQ